MISSERSRFARYKHYLLLWLALSIIYHSNARPIPSGDTMPAALIPITVLVDGSATLDRTGPFLQERTSYRDGFMSYRRGHWFSVYPIAGPILVTPLYLPILLVPGISSLDPDTLILFARIYEKFAAVFISALAAALLFALLERMTTRRWAWLLTFIYALGTESWSISSQALWQHTNGCLMLIAALLLLDIWWSRRESLGNLAGAGVAAAVAMMIRPTNALLIPAVFAALLVVRARPREWMAFLAGPILCGGVLAAYNLYVFSTPTGGYAYPFTGSFQAGFAGILVSPGRGLLIYSPVLLFGLVALLPRCAQAWRPHLPVFVSSVLFVPAYVVVVARWPVWWGGYCWGPRLLAELSPFLVALLAMAVPAIRASSTVKALFATAALWSIFTQGIGAHFYPKGEWNSRPVAVDHAPARLWDWRDNPISRTVAAGPAFEPYDVIITAVRSGMPAARQRLGELKLRAY